MTASGTLEVISTSDAGRWNEVVSRAENVDFCHLLSCHRVAERNGEGVAHLFVYHDGPAMVAIPLLIRLIADESDGPTDATSVYGYGGPVVSAPELSHDVVTGFQAALAAELRERRVVSVFSRMHPLIHTSGMIEGLGLVRTEGQTISIDLADGQGGTRGYNQNCRRSLRKLQNIGVQAFHDSDKRYLTDFAAIYAGTMKRSDAAENYRYSLEYFEWLASELGDVLRLFVAEYEGVIIAASLVTRVAGIVQDYLGGTSADYLRWSPDRLIVDTERQWALESGAHVLHLGGGRGSSADSLLAYKAAFSDRRHDFATWRWILDATAYEHLTSRAGSGAALGVAAPRFPEYRPMRGNVARPHTD
jgi:hypothetical protein